MCKSYIKFCVAPESDVQSLIKCLKWWNEIKRTECISWVWKVTSDKSICQMNLMSCNVSLLKRRPSPSPSLSKFMKGFSFFSNKTAVSVWFLLSALHVISSRIICTNMSRMLENFNQLSICLNILHCIFVIITLPEASPEPSSQLRRSRGCGRVLSGLEPIRLIYVKRSPSGSQSPCSPGCPLRLPVLSDDAWKKWQTMGLEV